jgi:hypothetical protein
MKRRGTQVARAITALVALLALPGCLKKASWVPNDHGGYTLMTRASSMDQALTRFRRSGEELCHGSRYALSEPVIAAKGWSFNGYGGGTDITVRSDLSCQ